MPTVCLRSYKDYISAETARDAAGLRYTYTIDGGLFRGFRIEPMTEAEIEDMKPKGRPKIRVRL